MGPGRRVGQRQTPLWGSAQPILEDLVIGLPYRNCIRFIFVKMGNIHRLSLLENFYSSKMEILWVMIIHLIMQDFDSFELQKRLRIYRA